MEVLLNQLIMIRLMQMIMFMHEDDEKIYFLIKSKSDGCFTNKAIIHLDGTSAMSEQEENLTKV